MDIEHSSKRSHAQERKRVRLLPPTLGLVMVLFALIGLTLPSVLYYNRAVERIHDKIKNAPQTVTQLIHAAQEKLYVAVELASHDPSLLESVTKALSEDDYTSLAARIGDFQQYTGIPVVQIIRPDEELLVSFDLSEQRVRESYFNREFQATDALERVASLSSWNGRLFIVTTGPLVMEGELIAKLAMAFEIDSDVLDEWANQIDSNLFLQVGSQLVYAQSPTEPLTQTGATFKQTFENLLNDHEQKIPFVKHSLSGHEGEVQAELVVADSLSAARKNLVQLLWSTFAFTGPFIAAAVILVVLLSRKLSTAAGRILQSNSALKTANSHVEKVLAATRKIAKETTREKTIIAALEVILNAIESNNKLSVRAWSRQTPRANETRYVLMEWPGRPAEYAKNLAKDFKEDSISVFQSLCAPDGYPSPQIKESHPEICEFYEDRFQIRLHGNGHIGSALILIEGVQKELLPPEVRSYIVAISQSLEGSLIAVDAREEERCALQELATLSAHLSDRLNSPLLSAMNAYEILEKSVFSAQMSAQVPAHTLKIQEKSLSILSQSLTDLRKVSAEITEMREHAGNMETTQLITKKEEQAS